MSEGKQKTRKYFNQDALQALKDKYGYGYDYIRKSIVGDRVGIIPDRIKKEYDQLVKASQEVIKDISTKKF